MTIPSKKERITIGINQYGDIRRGCLTSGTTCPWSRCTRGMSSMARATRTSSIPSSSSDPTSGGPPVRGPAVIQPRRQDVGDVLGSLLLADVVVSHLIVVHREPEHLSQWRQGFLIGSPLPLPLHVLVGTGSVLVHLPALGRHVLR